MASGIRPSPASIDAHRVTDEHQRAVSLVAVRPFWNEAQEPAVAHCIAECLAHVASEAAKPTLDQRPE